MRKARNHVVDVPLTELAKTTTMQSDLPLLLGKLPLRADCALHPADVANVTHAVLLEELDMMRALHVKPQQLNSEVAPGDGNSRSCERIS